MNRSAALLCLFPLMTQAADYAARRTSVDDVEIVQLLDNVRHIEVSIAPPVGNIAYEMKVNGQNVLWAPFYSPAELRDKQPFCCIPFLAPWANRLDDDSYWADGKKFLLNSDLGNIRRDANRKPIHGLLTFTPLWT